MKIKIIIQAALTTFSPIDYIFLVPMAKPKLKFTKNIILITNEHIFSNFYVFYLILVDDTWISCLT